MPEAGWSGFTIAAHPNAFVCLVVVADPDLVFGPVARFLEKIFDLEGFCWIFDRDKLSSLLFATFQSVIPRFMGLSKSRTRKTQKDYQEDFHAMPVFINDPVFFRLPALPYLFRLL